MNPVLNERTFVAPLGVPQRPMRLAFARGSTPLTTLRTILSLSKGSGSSRAKRSRVEGRGKGRSADFLAANFWGVGPCALGNPNARLAESLATR